MASEVLGSTRLLRGRISLALEFNSFYNISTLSNSLKLRGLQGLICMWEDVTSISQAPGIVRCCIYRNSESVGLPGEVLTLLGLLLAPTVFLNTRSLSRVNYHCPAVPC